MEKKSHFIYKIDNPEDIFNNDPRKGKIVLRDLLNNAEKLKGKELDGHLKTKLLFQYLKDYKKLQEERELGMFVVQAEGEKGEKKYNKKRKL